MAGPQNGVEEPALQLHIECAEVVRHPSWATKSSVRSVDGHSVRVSRKSWRWTCLRKAAPLSTEVSPSRQDPAAPEGRCWCSAGDLQSHSARGEQWIQFPLPFADFTISRHWVAEGKDRLWRQEQCPGFCDSHWLPWASGYRITLFLVVSCSLPGPVNTAYFAAQQCNPTKRRRKCLPLSPASNEGIPFSFSQVLKQMCTPWSAFGKTGGRRNRGFHLRSRTNWYRHHNSGGSSSLALPVSYWLLLRWPAYVLVF